MTRKEEISKAAEKELKDCPYINTSLIGFDFFIKGAEWADSHSPWISVEDELPPYGEQVLVFAKEDPDYEMWWSERYTEKGAKWGEYEILTDKNRFASMRDENNEPLQVSHWMKITPPILSNSENTGKDLKGGEE